MTANKQKQANGFAAELAKAVTVLDLGLNEAQQHKLLAYLALLAKWNRAYNLTSIPQSQWLTELLLDSLVALPHIHKARVLDVGTGAGLPGIPLAIARPDLRLTLLDSNGKKTRFIKQVAIDLQIPNLDVVQSRVEDFKPDTGYDLVVSRAYAELDVFLHSTSHLLAIDGEWLAWKGSNVAQEVNRLSMPVEVKEIISISLPDVPERYLVRIAKDNQENLGE